MRAALVAVVLLALAVAATTSSARPVPARTTVGCDLSVGSAEALPREAQVILDRIGLPRGRYPWRLTRSLDPRYPLWGKWGALVRGATGEAVTLSIARPWRRHAVIGWGNGTALSVRFLPCDAPATWLAFAGGFNLKKRGCVPFDVQVGDRIERVRIAFGRACVP